MFRHGHTLSHTSVEEADHLEVEGGTDPYGVGVDQFLADVGSTVATSVRDHRLVTLRIRRIRKLNH